jgi:hypothetical protein
LENYTRRFALGYMRDLNWIRRKLYETKRWGDPQPDVAERAGYKCEYCGLDLLASLRNYRQWQLDHIVPQSAGGTDDIENIVLACKYCNCDVKGTWNPNPDKKSLTRDELVAIVRAYLPTLEAQKSSNHKSDCDIIGYRDGQLLDPYPGEEPKSDPGEEPKSDPGEEPKSDPGEEPKSDPGEEPKSDPDC